jgi:hypothetical protein
VVVGGWLVGWWLAGWLVGWLAGWLAGWLVGWLAGWLAGWLVYYHWFRFTVPHGPQTESFLESRFMGGAIFENSTRSTFAGCPFENSVHRRHPLPKRTFCSNSKLVGCHVQKTIPVIFKEFDTLALHAP